MDKSPINPAQKLGGALIDDCYEIYLAENLGRA